MPRSSCAVVLRSRLVPLGEWLRVNPSIEQHEAVAQAVRVLLDHVGSARCQIVLLRGADSGEQPGFESHRFVVIEEDVPDAFAETARLSREIGRMLIPGEVIVMTREQAETRRRVTGTLAHEAFTRGEVVGES